ncbi:MAG: metallophosphoesterase family protein [Clostridia bacterium]|nr:metallophosphoesterase family protein [Clostridia bacterium]
MRTLIVTDIHGNLPALEAVLAAPEARSCQEIISLGDHVNFCAQSRAVHDRLISLGAVMLLGNHEERLTRPDDAEFAGYNWEPMRFAARQMGGIDLRLPLDLRRGEVLLTHGTPGEPYHLVHPEELPGVLNALPEGVTLLLSGHNHIRWAVEADGRTAVNPGSTGLLEIAGPARQPDFCGTAPFAVLETEAGQPPVVTLHEARYDVRETLRAFIETGMCRAAPEICRSVARVLLTQEYQGGLMLMRHVRRVAAENGLDFGSREAWKLADRTYPWDEAVPSDEYWKQLEDTL